jgi:hypothetical protein
MALPDDGRPIHLIGEQFLAKSIARPESISAEWHAMGQLPGRPR